MADTSSDAPAARTGSFSSVWQRFLAGAALRWGARIERMPREKALAAGMRWGRVGYAVAKRPRQIAAHNLHLAYGDTLSVAERDALVRRVFEHFGMVTMDFLRSRTYTPEFVRELVVETEGYEEYGHAAWEQGKGVVAITAHLGNFEMFARWVAARGYSLTAVVRDPDDPVLGTFVRRLRESGGYQVASKGSSARQLLRTLHERGVVGILPDQNSGDVFAPFFGTPAGTPAGPAHLALKTGAPLVPCFCVRRPDNRYKLVFLPPIQPEPTGDRDADIARLMTATNGAIETAVRAYPDQYLWLHNRWKSAFEDKNRARWPEGFDFEASRARWRSVE